MDKTNIPLIFDYQIKTANFFKVGKNYNYWGPRVIPDFEFIYVVNGNAEYWEEKGNRIQINTNELILIPPNLKHSFSCKKSPDAIISCIHFTPPNNNMVFNNFIINLYKDIEILNLFKKCSVEFDLNSKFSSEILNCLLREIILRVTRIDQSKDLESLPSKLKIARQIIRENFNKTISRSDIASKLEISKEHLNFLFKKHCNISPLEYLRDLRIKRAKLLLRNSAWNITQVAFEVGYEDPLYFSRIFKKVVGVSPKVYAQGL